MIRPVVLLTLAPLLAWSEPVTVEKRCRLEDGSTALLQSASSIDGKRLFLALDGRTEPAFTDMPTSDFVGELKMAECRSGTLVFALNYGSPYTKGVAIRRRRADRQWERIDFAEKAFPQWLLLGGEGMQLVFPNQGTSLRPS